MSTDHVSSHRMAHLGSRAMREPETLTLNEIRELGASVVSQAPNHTTRNWLIASLEANGDANYLTPRMSDVLLGRY